MIHSRNHTQTVMIKPRKKTIEQRLRSKDKNEFYEVVDELKKDPEFMKELRRVNKSLVGISS